METESKNLKEEQKSNKGKFQNKAEQLDSFFAPLFSAKKFPSFAYTEKKVEANDYGEVEAKYLYNQLDSYHRIKRRL